MSNKWDNKLTEKFLKLYRKHKCLWNPYSPNYRNCGVKNEAFKTVIQELNNPQIKISECLQQIEVIREKYKEEQVKAEKELKAGKLYNSQVPWFKLMSQMLCEVINDEENFIDEPVEFVPCKFTKGEPSQDHPAKGFANLSRCVVQEFEHVNSTGLKKQGDVKSFDNNFHLETISVNDKKDPWNKCPSCGWEKQNNHTSNNSIESEARFNDKKIDDVNKSSKEKSRNTPPCMDEMNRSNHWTPELDGTQPKKKVTVITDVESSQDSGLPERDYSTATNSTAVSSEIRNPDCPQNGEEHGKNITQTRCSDNADRSQFFNTDVRKETQKESGPVNETEGNEIVSMNRYDSCLQRFVESNPKFSEISDEDIRSRFKIIIPSPDEEDQNLEIIGYEVRGPIGELSKYVLRDTGGETSKAAIAGIECPCKTLVNKNATADSMRYGNVIKLNISQNRPSKRSWGSQKATETEAGGRLFSNTTTQTESYHGNRRNRSNFVASRSVGNQEYASGVSSMNETRNTQAPLDGTEASLNPLQSRLIDESLLSDNPQEIDGNSIAPTEKFNNTKIFLNIIVKILESDDSQEVSQELHDTLESMLDRFQEMSISMSQNPTESNNNSRDRSWNTNTLSTQHRNLPMALAPANTQANNTNPRKRIDKTMELNDTTYTGLRPQPPIPEYRYHGELPGNDSSYFEPVERRNRVANGGVNASQQNSRILNGTNNSSNERRLRDGAADSFQHQDVNASRQNSSYRNAMPGNDTSYLLPENGRSNSARRDVDNNQNSRVLNKSNRSNNERRSRNEITASLLDSVNTSNHTASSDLANINEFSRAEPVANSTATSNLDYSLDYNDFSRNEPVASSSRNFREPRTQNQLTKEFLDVLKYTMMMDGVEELDENGQRQGRNKLNDSQHLRK